MNNEFETFYPNVYSAEDRAVLDRFRAERDRILCRSELDIGKLVSGELNSDTPGVGQYIDIKLSEALYAGNKYDPDNPLYNDQDYARGTQYGDIMAYPGFVSLDHAYMIPMPAELRDILLVSGIRHETTWLAPVHPGDRIFFVVDDHEYTDITPEEGSEYRTFAIRGTGRVFNQNGVHVASAAFGCKESLKRYADPEKRCGSLGGPPLWECPNWWTRPFRYYTDADWETIKGIWLREFRRGAEPLYWEDVQVGDEPAWTLEGPYSKSPRPSYRIGLGTGGSRTLRKEILGPRMRKFLIRGERDGIYRTFVDYTPDYAPDPDHDMHQHMDGRDILINYLCRDVVIRMLNNWMGEQGWIQYMKWEIMPVPIGYEDRIPDYPDAPKYLDNVPYMKGKRPMVHGMSTDVCIVKSYVHDKYEKDGEFFAELTWWCETFDGGIFCDGIAGIKLPSRKK